jgi:hypothetical protein
MGFKAHKEEMRELRRQEAVARRRRALEKRAKRVMREELGSGCYVPAERVALVLMWGLGI